jgi:hypothetical protein
MNLENKCKYQAFTNIILVSQLFKPQLTSSEEGMVVCVTGGKKLKLVVKCLAEDHSRRGWLVSGPDPMHL